MAQTTPHTQSFLFIITLVYIYALQDGIPTAAQQGSFEARGFARSSRRKAGLVSFWESGIGS